MNTRIQVEHGVTEEVTGIDLVQQQILLSAGADLPAQPSAMKGHAIEVRLYAEDAQTLMPSTGMLRSFDMPKLFGVRVEKPAISRVKKSVLITMHFWLRSPPRAAPGSRLLAAPWSVAPSKVFAPTQLGCCGC